MTDSKSTTTLTVPDITALAERLAVAAVTSRRVDWPAIQNDLQIAARLFLTLIRTGKIDHAVELDGGQ